MKFCFQQKFRKRNQFKKSSKSFQTINLLENYDQNHRIEQRIFPINESNNMTLTNEGSGDDRIFVPSPVDEQQIANAQEKVDRLINIISETYEKTLMRNLRLEDLDTRSSDLFRDAEKMKNMAHKMQDKFFWDDKYYLIVILASLSAIILGGLLALIFIPKLSSS